MNRECQKCGTTYNDQTVEKCPACNFKKKINHSRDNSILSYRNSEIKKMKRQVVSQMVSDRVAYETQTGRQIFKKTP